MPRYIYHFQYPSRIRAPYMDVLDGFFFVTVFCPFTLIPFYKEPVLFALVHLTCALQRRNIGLWRAKCQMIACIICGAGMLYLWRYMRFLHIRLCGKINFAQLSSLIKMSRFTFIFTCKEIITLNWTCFFYYMSFTFVQNNHFKLKIANGCFMRKSRNELDKLLMSPCVSSTDTFHR